MDTNNTPENTKAPLPPRKWLDAQDVMELLHISYDTLKNWCRRGILKPIYPSGENGKMYFDIDDIDAMMEEAKQRKAKHYERKKKAGKKSNGCLQ